MSKKEIKATVKEQAGEAKGFFKQMFERAQNLPTSAYVVAGVVVGAMGALILFGGA